MRIGLLADIHEDVDGLEAAIGRCRREGVDRLVTLGDIFETGEQFADAVDLLREADVSGVWGNHEFALYAGRGDSVESQFRLANSRLHERLTARHEVDGVLFSHVLPCLDPTDVEQPWYVERAPSTAEAAARNFAAFPHRRMFVGHFHRWLAVTPDGPLDWAGDRPFQLDRDTRYLVVVAAVCDGWCAIYDTKSDVLTPLQVRSGNRRRARCCPVGNLLNRLRPHGAFHQGTTSGLTIQIGMPVRDIATQRFDGMLPEAFTEQIGIAGDMRRDHDVIEARIGSSGAGGSGSSTSRPAACDPALGEGADERLLVDDLSPRGVDQDGLGFHQPQLSFADRVTGLFRERHVDRDEIGPREQLVEADFLDAVLGHDARIDSRVAGDDVHFEPGDLSGDQAGDAAEANAGRTSGQRGASLARPGIGPRLPAGRAASCRAICRITANNRPMACSATWCIVASGVLATTMPSRVASATGMLSVPVPVRRITRHFCKSGSTSGVITREPPIVQTTSASGGCFHDFGRARRIRARRARSPALRAVGPPNRAWEEGRWRPARL